MVQVEVGGESVRDIGDGSGPGVLGACGSGEVRWMDVGCVMVVVFKRAHTNKHINRLARDQSRTYGCGPE